MADRVPCGRISTPSPAQRREDAQAVVIDQRVRHHGRTKEQAGSDLAGDVIGRLLQDAWITRDALNAGRAYQRLAYEAGRTSAGPPALTACPIEPRTRGYNNAPDLPHEAHIRRDWEEARIRFGRADPVVLRILDAVLLEEMDPRVDDVMWRVFARGLSILMEMYCMRGAAVRDERKRDHRSPAQT